ncbi:glycoside hydrolase family 65 protein [Propionibacteriaceae bacterium Y1700]|uniref:glycoside hydrolase family 65 protein n=1 Tax=Microlunatus sp. Y1700 TaxID=3418487 RepID=UPI003DA6EE47
MTNAEPDPLDRHRFPIDEWRLVESVYSTDDLGASETCFSVGNGYLGMRGNPEEGRESHTHGTFINGFHETWPIHHAEEAYGFAQTGQTIINVPDTKVLKLYVDDEPLLLSDADLESYERSIDFSTGVLTRDLIWRSPAGKRVKVSSTRMVSFTERHLAIMTMEVTLLDGDAPVVISSQVLNRQDGKDEYHVKDAAMGSGFDPRKAQGFASRVLDPISTSAADDRILMGYRCMNSKMTLGVGVDHAIVTDNPYVPMISAEEDYGKMVYRVDARAGQPILVTKTVAYHTSKGVPARELVDRCVRTLDRVRRQGTEVHHQQQKAWLDDFWANADVEIPGQPAVQQAVRWNLFQVAQAAARAEQNGISAKGVSGSGYEGHYFWDTEIYVLPFLTYTRPAMARNALRFRYQMLPSAQHRAAVLSQRGALFPWRTINGEEASAYYAAGTAQYHIDADISYALCRYVEATGDDTFMLREGVDILVETARMWADLGFWRSNGEETFNIHGVTGPDEYTTVVNNNLFTNVMAKDNLQKAADHVRRLRELSPDGYAALADRLELDESEIDDWERAARGMWIPFDENLGIHPQDDHFLEGEVWELAQTPPERRPLLLHYHPLVIYRFQVLKQADVCMALFLQGDLFTREEKRADFEYYDPITTGDSTLSAIVQSIISAEVGYHEMAMNYFHAGLFVDLADLHANAADGVHVASTGGVWAMLVHGFGGMRDHHGRVNFDPRLPQSWERLTFRLNLQGSRIKVDLTDAEITFTLELGDPVTVRVRDEEVEVSGTTTIALADQGPRLEGALGTLPLISGRREDGSVITAGVPDPSIPDFVPHDDR